MDKAKAQLPEFLAVDTDDSEDDEDFTLTISVPRAAHDDEAGTSSGPAPVPSPVTAAQVSQPDSLAALMQTLAEEQRSQREIQNRLLAEQARQVEAQTLLFQELRQQQEAVRQQLHIQSQQQ